MGTDGRGGGLVVGVRTLSRPAAFWSVAVLLVLVLAASGVPSPLYRVYAEEFGFSSGVLTVVFAVYAIALLAALLVVGGLSDHVGRRPVLAVALLLEAVAGADLDHPPVAQWRGRRQSAPVRSGQRRQREAEGDRRAIRLPAERRE